MTKAKDATICTVHDRLDYFCYCSRAHLSLKERLESSYGACIGMRFDVKRIIPNTAGFCTFHGIKPYYFSVYMPFFSLIKAAI